VLNFLDSNEGKQQEADQQLFKQTDRRKPVHYSKVDKSTEFMTSKRETVKFTSILKKNWWDGQNEMHCQKTRWEKEDFFQSSNTM